MDLTKSLRELLEERRRTTLTEAIDECWQKMWPTPEQHAELQALVGKKIQENVAAAVRENLECLSRS